MLCPRIAWNSNLILKRDGRGALPLVHYTEWKKDSVCLGGLTLVAEAPVCVCPWLIYGSAGVDCDSHSFNCSLPTQQEDNRAPRTITKSDIALFECAKSQRMGIFGIRTVLRPKIAPAERAESREGGNRLKGRAILGGTKRVEVHRRSAETNVVSEGSSHLPSIFPQTDSKRMDEERTHPIQRSHTPSVPRP